MLKYGTDKPDLRNPLEIKDITNIFIREDVKFEIFKKLVKSGSIVRTIVTKNTAGKARGFFDNIDKWAKEQGASGLAYFSLEKDKSLSAKGPIGKFFSEDSLKELMKICDAELGDSFFLACGNETEVETILSAARNKIGEDLKLIDPVITAQLNLAGDPLGCKLVDFDDASLFEKYNEFNNLLRNLKKDSKSKNIL